MNKSQQAPHALLAITTETPFNKRRDCWFCGEPHQMVFYCSSSKPLSHTTHHEDEHFSLPSCAECYQVARKHIASAKQQILPYSIWTARAAVKHYILTQYQQDLAIGLNWTKAELAESEFEQGNFAGFQQSAWFMYEVAKERVNYSGWPLMVDGIHLIDEHQQDYFNFDGVTYPNIEHASHHYCHTFSLDIESFHAVLALLGPNHFANTIRFCRLLVGASRYERQQAIRELALEQSKTQNVTG